MFERFKRNLLVYKKNLSKALFQKSVTCKAKVQICEQVSSIFIIQPFTKLIHVFCNPLMNIEQSKVDILHTEYSLNRRIIIFETDG